MGKLVNEVEEELAFTDNTHSIKDTTVKQCDIVVGKTAQCNKIASGNRFPIYR